jgi:hypothetical protein
MGHSISLRHASIRRLNIGESTSIAVQTCISLSDVSTAVEIMEQGVGTIFQQMLQLKTDVDGLDLNQAEMYREFSSDLDSGKCQDSMQVAADRNDLLNLIRKQPGLEYFLLPKSYDLLQNAAEGGPILLLNSHQDGCDGVIILKTPGEQGTSKPVHVAISP